MKNTEKPYWSSLELEIYDEFRYSNLDKVILLCEKNHIHIPKSIKKIVLKYYNLQSIKKTSKVYKKWENKMSGTQRHLHKSIGILGKLLIIISRYFHKGYNVNKNTKYV